MSDSPTTKPKADGDSEPFYADFSKDKEKRNVSSQMMKKVDYLIYWKDPMQTGGYFGAGLLWFYFTTLGGYTVISLVSIGLILHMIFMIVTSMISSFRGHDASGGKAPQVDVEMVKMGIDGAVAAVNGVLSWYYSLLGASNLMASLYVMGGLIVAWIAGSWFELYTLCFIAYVMAFSLPVAYSSNKQVVDEALVKVQGQIEQAVDKVKAQIPKAGKAEDGKKNS